MKISIRAWIGSNTFTAKTCLMWFHHMFTNIFVRFSEYPVNAEAKDSIKYQTNHLNGSFTGDCYHRFHWMVCFHLLIAVILTTLYHIRLYATNAYKTNSQRIDDRRWQCFVYLFVWMYRTTRDLTFKNGTITIQIIYSSGSIQPSLWVSLYEYFFSFRSISIHFQPSYADSSFI